MSAEDQALALQCLGRYFCQRCRAIPADKLADGEFLAPPLLVAHCEGLLHSSALVPEVESGCSRHNAVAAAAAPAAAGASMPQDWRQTQTEPLWFPLGFARGGKLGRSYPDGIRRSAAHEAMPD